MKPDAQPGHMKYVVTYSADYKHVVKVGAIADTPENAVLLVRGALDIGTVWDNAPDMPLLYDQYAEAEQGGIQFDAEAVGQFPEPDPSAAFQATILPSMLDGLESLQQMAGFTSVAISASGMGPRHQGINGCPSCGRDIESSACQSDDCPSYPDGTLWNVASGNGCDPFEVNAPSFHDALIEALNALGWSITPAS